MKSLVFAEKPSVAREIARVLGCRQKSKGYIEGDRYIVTWALGHLVGLAEPADYNPEWKSWRLNHLPMLPEEMKLKPLKDVKAQYRIVASLLKRKDVNLIIIATDAGREGELVARWVLKLAKCKKAIKRLWISSQTDTAIKQGFAQLKDGKAYENLYMAAQARAEADWIMGLNTTRALTTKYDAQLNTGRVQTPTLYMIVERDASIKKFVPQEYYRVRAQFDGYYGHWQDAEGRGRLGREERADAIMNKIKDQSGKVINIKEVKKSEQHPLAYDLTELQRDANRKFMWSAKHTLTTLQGLYERHKVVTYPRTDSRYITKDIVATIPNRIKHLTRYAKYVNAILARPLQLTTRFVNDAKVSDHHAIITTEQVANLSLMTTDEKKLYDIIARRFLSVMLPPHIYVNTQIITQVKGENFISRGKSIKESGWKALTQVLSDDETKDKDADQRLRTERVGSIKKVLGYKKEKDQTKPPAHYNEASLLSAMENPGKFLSDKQLQASIKDGGLGTPATRADIIEKLINSYNIEREGKHLKSTAKGVQLIALAPPALKSPRLTAQWESRLAMITQGKQKKAAFLSDVEENVKQIIDEIKASTAEYKPDNLIDEKCPSCGKKMMIVRDKKGKNKKVCSDRRCGYEKTEVEKGLSTRRKSRDQFRMDKQLLNKYGQDDVKDVGDSLGDMLEAALKKK